MARTKKTDQEAPPQAPAPGEAAPAATYAVQWHVKLDGRRYGPGERVALNETDAQRLIASGAVAPATTTE